MNTERIPDTDRRFAALSALNHARAALARAVRAGDAESVAVYLAAETWAQRELTQCQEQQEQQQ